MSPRNVSMKPIWGSMMWRHVTEDSPSTTHDIVSEKSRAIGACFPACLIIDYDDAVLTDYKVAKAQTLIRHISTPMYIACSACKRRVRTNNTYRLVPRMRQLLKKSRTLYVGAHGEERYERYNDTKATPHGACPPVLEETFEEPPQVYHRPEHDAESIYWSLLSVLLHVHPMGVEGEPTMPMYFADAWESLLSHRIPEVPWIYANSSSVRAWRIGHSFSLGI